MRARGCCWALPHSRWRAGDKIGLVGRNGAGKTTLARVLAAEGAPAAGTVRNNGSVGYLPQDTRVGDLDALAMDRVLSARGLDALMAGLREAEVQMADANPARRDAAVRRYGHLEERLTVLGGYAAEAEAASLAASLGLPQQALRQPLRTLSGGQRRRVELARILFGGSQTLLLDEPTNHLDADSVSWLRDHLRAFRGGLVVISHDTRAARGGGQQGVPPGRRPRVSWTSTTWAGRPTWTSARPMRGGGGGSGERGAPGHRAAVAGGQDAGQGDQGQGRAEHAAPGGAAAGRGQRRAGAGPGGQAARSRCPRTAAGPR